MNSKFLLVLLVILMFIGYKFLTGLNSNWTGFFYPNGDTMSPIKSPIYKSKDECFGWIDLQLRRYGDSTSHDYECGKNCKLSGSGVGLYICDETSDTRE